MVTYSRQVVRSFLWQGGAQGVAQVVSWLATIVVIRLLSPADYGLMAMAGVFLGFFLLFADLGFGAAAVQARTIEREQLRRMFGIVLITNLGACLVTVASAPAIATFFGEPRLAGIVRLLALNFLLIASYVLPQSQLLREMDFRTKARIDVLALVAGSAAALGSAAAGAGVWALVTGAIVTHGAKAAAYNIVRPVVLMPAFAFGALNRIAQFGALLTLDRLLFFLYGQVDMVIGGRVLGKEALGLYAIALSVAAIPMEKVLPVIAQVSFAAYSRIQAEPERVRRNLLRSVRLISLVCFPAFLGMAAVAGDLIPVVLGPRWLELVLPFQILCLVLPLKAVAATFPPALFGVGRPGVNVVNMTVSLVVMAVAMLIGVRHGVVGMCLAWLIAYPLVFGVISWRSLHVLGVRYGDFLHQCAFPAAASIVMALSVLGLRESVGSQGFAPVRLGALVAAGVILYGVSVFLFQRVVVRELVAVARS